jgi:hypothetical protein
MMKTTKMLLWACATYLAIQVIGAVLSVAYGLPGEVTFDAPGKPDEVLSDILHGKGAALVVPIQVLIALIVCMFLARSRRWWGPLAVVGICALSVLFAFAMYLEPVTGRVFPPSVFELPVAVMVALFIAVPLLMLSLGMLDLIGRVRTRKQTTAEG